MNPSLAKRFYQYQKERYPFLAYIVLIGIFSFSAISYSLQLRNQEHFIDLKWFLLCVFNAVIIFFLLRISDEFKDREDDAKFRTYLPVPRGLISLRELRSIAMVAVLLQVTLNLWMSPEILILLGAVYGYMFLMYHEFFVRSWLKKNQFWYVISHMMIIPIVDVFASGYDWFLKDENAPKGLIIFFLVSFFNGLSLEIGRKIKAPEDEEVGVLSYTFQVGTKNAIYLWLFVLFITYGLGIYACWWVNHGLFSYLLLSVFWLLGMVPGFMFLVKHNKKRAKAIELAASIWTLMLYLVISGVLNFTIGLS